MTPEDVAKHYHGPERYNCAQAVLRGFQEQYKVPQEMIDEFRKYGAGRSDGNWCGALYAARHLLNDPKKTEILEQKFAEITGGMKCKELRKKNQVSCKGCVEAAAKLLIELNSQEAKNTA